MTAMISACPPSLSIESATPRSFSSVRARRRTRAPRAAIARAVAAPSLGRAGNQHSLARHFHELSRAYPDLPPTACGIGAPIVANRLRVRSFGGCSTPFTVATSTRPAGPGAGARSLGRSRLAGPALWRPPCSRCWFRRSPRPRAAWWRRPCSRYRRPPLGVTAGCSCSSAGGWYGSCARDGFGAGHSSTFAGWSGCPSPTISTATRAAPSRWPSRPTTAAAGGCTSSTPAATEGSTSTSSRGRADHPSTRRHGPGAPSCRCARRASPTSVATWPSAPTVISGSRWARAIMRSAARISDA